MSVRRSNSLLNGKQNNEYSNKSRKIRILLVEGHTMLRDGLKMFLNKEPDIEVCDVTESINDTIDKIKKLKPDLMIVDISNIGMSGLDLIKKIRENFNNHPIIVLSMYEGSFLTEKLKAAGASTCVDSLKVIDTLLDKIHKLVKI